MVPSSDGGDYPVWVCGPCEGVGVGIGVGNKAVDGGLEVDDGAQDPAFQSSSGEFGEAALDSIEPGARGRREVEDKAPALP